MIAFFHKAGLLRARFLTWALVLSAATIVTLGYDRSYKENFAPEQTQDTLLEDGKPIAAEMFGGQSHSYKVLVGAGEYVHLIAEQRGMDIVARLMGPDGILITAVDNPNGSRGAEPVHVVADAPGTYRIEIISFDKNAAAGRYEISIVERRPIIPSDRIRISARKAFDEAESLSSKRDRVSLEGALSKYQESLRLYRSIGDKSEEYTLLLGTGICYWTRKEYEKAVELFGQALQAAQVLGDKYRQARALDRASYAYREFADIDDSIKTGIAGFELFGFVGSSVDQAQLARHLGSMFNIVGDFERAREYFTQAIDLNKKAGNRRNESSNLGLIGYSYELEQNYAKAVEFRKKALAVARELKQPNQVDVELATLAAQYASVGDRRAALETIAAVMPDTDAEKGLSVTSNIGLAYYKLGEFDKALKLLNRSRELARSDGASGKRSEAIVSRHLAAVFRDQGKLNEAMASIENSITLLEFLRDHAGSPEMQMSFVASLFDYYEFYIDLKMRLDAADPSSGYSRTALEFAEKVKVRGLLDLLSRARVDARQGLDQNLLKLEAELNADLTDRLDELAKLERGKPTEEQKASVNQKVTRSRDALREIQMKIRGSDAHYAGLTTADPLSVAEIQERILDSDTMLLEYQLGDVNSYLWAVSKVSVKSYRLPSRNMIEGQSKRVYELMTARQTAARSLKNVDTSLRTESQKLSDMLLGPAVADISAKRLVIVADGVLHYLPFAALPVPSSGKNIDNFKPMLLDHEIVNLPSASVLGILRQEVGKRKPAQLAAAVLADPVYSSQDARVPPAKARTTVRGSGATGSFARLLFSRDEANAILSVTQPQSSLLAMDFAANRRFAMGEELSKYRIIHFSTHGTLDSTRPELSALALSQVDETGASIEGSLRLNEIYRMRLNADLVVLSGCQTGLGKDIRGEGLVGLTRGFMFAGSPRVVASLWQVDDAATAELMKIFYTRMIRQGMAPAAALRSAQIEMLKKPMWRSPYYWAAFVLQGEWK